jgi:chromosome segregation ATPase
LEKPEGSEYSQEFEDSRKQCEREVKDWKDKLNTIDDKLKLIKMKLSCLSDDSIDGEQASEGKLEHLFGLIFYLAHHKTDDLQDDIYKNHQYLKDLEELLKSMKQKRQFVSTKEGTDYLVIIEELRNDLESEIGSLQDKLSKVEDAQSKTEFRSHNNESRIEELENQIKTHNDQLLNISKALKSCQSNVDALEGKIKDLENHMNDKVNCDDFNKQISCKYLNFSFIIRIFHIDLKE